MMPTVDSFTAEALRRLSFGASDEDARAADEALLRHARQGTTESRHVARPRSVSGSNGRI